jgi:hypothetical protein
MRILVFIPAVLFTINIYAQRQEIVTSKYTYTEQEEVSGKPFLPDQLTINTSHKYYNKAGQIYREVYFNENPDTTAQIQSSEIKTIYNKNGKIAEQVTIRNGEYAVSKKVEKYNYNAKGQKVRIESSTYLGNNPSKLLSKGISNLLYNSIDSLAFQLDSTANFNGTEPTWYINGNKYEYDSKKRLIKYGLTLDPNEVNVPPYYEYIYQSNNGQEIKITNFYYQGKVSNSDTLIKSTNNIGLKIESISKYGGTNILQYNSLGQLIEKADTSSYRISNTKYTYNNVGQVINEKVFYDDTFTGYAHVAKGDYQVNYRYDDKNRIINYNSNGWFITNNNHPKLKYFFQINVDTEYTTNLEKESEPDDVLIYPNPAKSKIQITNALNIECMQSISITNTLGEQLFYQNFPNKEYIFEPGETYIPNTNGTCSQIVNLPDLPNGMYFVNIKTGTNKLITKKLMIAK